MSHKPIRDISAKRQNHDKHFRFLHVAHKCQINVYIFINVPLQNDFIAHFNIN